MADTVRIDKFLWCVRLYKTRSVASDALKRGKVAMGGAQVKSSRNIKVGDVIDVRVPGGIRSFEVTKLPKSRMGAKLVAEHIREVTPKEQMEQLEMFRLQMSMQRHKGLGRPTKKERRDMESFLETDDDEMDIFLDDEDEDE